MIPIDRPGILFHIMAMDFIALLLTSDNFDYLLIVTNKFFKRVLVISGRIIFNVAE